MIWSCAGMAQLVEHLTRNEKVAGSNPATSSTEKPAGSGSKGLRVFILYDWKT